jgi:hypothetical protein
MTNGRLLILGLATTALTACADPASPLADGEPDPTALAKQDEGALYPADELVRGRTLSSWNARWWEWHTSIPEATSPALDGDCQQNQDERVFFLAGTYGGGAHFRSCEVPSDTPIFLPTVTAMYYTCAEVWGVEECDYGEQEMLDYGWMLQPARAHELSYSITLDGVELQGLDAYHLTPETVWLDYEGQDPSVIFWPAGSYDDSVPAEDAECASGWQEGNICGFDAGPKAGVSFGHGVAFRPLDPGVHTLHMVGARTLVPGDPPVFLVDVTYTLTVTDADENDVD